MLRLGGYVFKRAETPGEFEQIHSLNYRTFVREIPQHAEPGQAALVDKFHDKNIYFIAVADHRVVGMISAHSNPPFSVADRLPDPTILTRPGMCPMEVRLLAVESEKRNSVVCAGLLHALYLHAEEKGATHLFISGVRERIDLYRQLGFEPIGPAVQGGNAFFVPMAVSLSAMRDAKVVDRWLRRFARSGNGRSGSEEKGTRLRTDPPVLLNPEQARSTPPAVCLLPGPVTIAAHVQEAFHRAPIYHRGSDFLDLYEQVRRQLATMVCGRPDGCEVAILNGSGTLANEVVAATLAAEPRPKRGVMLVNGEFGQRLARQASRHSLNFQTMEWAWGSPWNLGELEATLRREPIGWVWGVHQESSTGILNDLGGLTALARRYGVRVCVDCISSLGAVGLDLNDVYLATGATGKALGSYAGAALVFARSEQLEHLDTERVPTYLDLPSSLKTPGPRFTFPSPTLNALNAALTAYNTAERAASSYERYRKLGMYVRGELRRVGIEPIAEETHAAPVLTTFYPPEDESSEAFVARCHFWGFDIGGASGYLQQRRLVQIATMGAIRQEDCAPLFEQLAAHSLVSQASV